jgi:hypothetical protein
MGVAGVIETAGGPWPLLNGGELAVLFGMTWLYLAFAGPGPWSLDAMRRGAVRERRTEGRLEIRS